MPSRLKSLELHGYKTFASRTEFAFAEMITAIVGPNGSGKSNIADSLRWVLGEQSYSLLRGKKTEDMIFAGSEHRPRAGMASATIVFDNSDGWLPIDFNEVAITRRAYRDGSNEYLVNRQRVRLKDVSELLSASGLAERTYTIIGQGLVDAALALKAEERRRLFEEAAGIGLHRARREEALRRLETTQRNLDRVQDILAELQPHLRTLERHARRAQEYDRLKGELRLLLRDWYGYHWHHAQREVEAAREAARLQETSVEQARAAQLAHDQKLAANRQQLSELREQIASLRQQLSHQLDQRAQCGREIAVADEKSRSLHSQSALAADEKARLEEEIRLHQELLENANQEEAQLAEEINEAQLNISDAREQLQQRAADRSQAEKDLRAASQSLSNLTEKQVQLEARLAERKAYASRLVDESQAVKTRLADAEAALQSAEANRKNAAAAHENLEVKRRSTEEALQALQDKLATAEQQLKSGREQHAASTAHLSRLQAQKDVLDAAESNLAGYASGARLILEAVRQSRLGGTRGLLSNLLDVPEGLEMAVAATLGEYLDAVVLAEQGQMDAALGLLEGQNARGALIPLDGLWGIVPLAPQTAAQLAGEPGVRGIAADLVSAPQELRPVVDLLLGRVVVVEDRSAARSLLRRLREAGLADLRVVTLRGEVFHASGAVLAGLEGRPASLSRQRQRRELAIRLSEGEKQVSSLSEKVNQLERSLAQVQVQQRRVLVEAQLAREAEQKAISALQRASLEVDKARQAFQFQHEQIDRLDSEQTRSQQEISHLELDLASLAGEIESSRAQVRSQSEALGALPLDELRAGAAFWETRLAVAEKALAGALSRIAERRQLLERASAALENAQKRMLSAQQELDGLAHEQEQVRQTAADLDREIARLTEGLAPAEQKLSTAESEQGSLLRVEAKSRQSLSLAEQRFTQTKVNLARQQESLESLRRRIEDDFGLVAFEYTEAISGPTPLPLEGLVEQLPFVEKMSQELEESIKRQRALLRRMGAVNPEAQAEYQEVKQRYDFLTEQVSDLEKAEADVKEVIKELDILMQREFRQTFEAVAQEFHQIFSRLFGGGSARLVLTGQEDLSETGIDIEARLPGRREQGLSLLSGGERSLAAAALIFALLKVSPTPFCVLDEVDAMLDETNVGRFRELLRELSANTQFVVVTHNRNTVQVADVIYGVTMGRDSTSQVISLKLDEISQVVPGD